MAQALLPLAAFTAIPIAWYFSQPAETPKNQTVKLHGNDILMDGHHYVISVYDVDDPSKETQKVFTYEGDDIYLRPYKPGVRAQIFRCALNSENRFELLSTTKAWSKLGINRNENLRCNYWPDSEDFRCAFEFRPSPRGGYSVLLPRNSDQRLSPLDITGSADKQWMWIRHESEALFGLTLIDFGMGNPPDLPTN